VASFFTASAADRSPALVGDVRGNLPGIRHLSHPMVRRPCAPDRWNCSFGRQMGELCLFYLPPREQTTHHALEYASSRTTGPFLNTPYQCVCKPADAPGWPIGRSAPQGDVRQKRDCIAAQEDDPLRRRQRASTLCPDFSPRNPRLSRHCSALLAAGARSCRAGRSRLPRSPSLRPHHAPDGR
jgi:hypothetical protein